MNEAVAAKLADIVREIHEEYQEIGYHTFHYWIRHDGGESFFADALEIFIEELYPAEWQAAWEPYHDDQTCLPRDPRPNVRGPFIRRK